LHLHSFVVRALRYERQKADLLVISNKLRTMMRYHCLPVSLGILLSVFRPTGLLPMLGWYLVGTAVASWVICLHMRLETGAQLRFVHSIERLKQ
ncbi:MAG: hypothetical protein KDD69_03180, partial [Bdellovibrionales bacterium]|nr:hypothetical protein [Bdellovibrionales bacterium]